MKQLIDVGVSKDELLNIEFEDGSKIELTNDQLEEMHLWQMTPRDIELMNKFIIWLRKYGVFFSAPLDIDFMMLKAFPEIYHSATEGTGPRIPARIDATAFSSKLTAATAAPLRLSGAMIAAMVAVAVVPIPKPTPWKNRKTSKMKIVRTPR